MNPEGDTTYSMKDDEEVRIGPDTKKETKSKKRTTKKKAIKKSD